ncbi:MAG TPA: hypothetical protein VIC84_03155 [Blastocatellia bacterium]
MTDCRRHWTRGEVDEAVAKWNRDFHLATKNILELMEDSSYKWLAGDGVHAPAAVKGLTEREARPAIKALDELWQLLPALNKLLDEVNNRHKNLPFFGVSDELFEIQKLIEGESVRITTRTAYEHRGLLTPDEVTKAATPMRILQAMVEGYDRAKTVVVKVGDAVAWLNGRLNQITDEVGRLRAIADSLGEPSPELRAVESRVSALSAEALSDPLSVADDFTKEILPAIEPVRRQLADLQAERSRLDNNIASAGALIASLEEAFTQAKTAYEERLFKVTASNADSLPRPFAVSVIDDLKRWLERLDATLRQGRWRAARVGFDNWKAHLDARLSECRTVAGENARLVNRRRELRGLLESLKAKAVNTGLAEDEALAGLYQEAYELLYSRPTPMGRAEKLVSDYLAAVR